MDTSARFVQAVTRANLVEQFGERVNESHWALANVTCYGTRLVHEDLEELYACPGKRCW
jgi:hypothetical protein